MESLGRKWSRGVTPDLLLDWFGSISEQVMFADVLRFHRLYYGVSRGYLAETLRMDLAGYHQLENGAYVWATDAMRLADVFGTSQNVWIGYVLTEQLRHSGAGEFTVYVTHRRKVGASY